MEKTKMTIHRGLAELKLLDKKIDKAIASFIPVGMKQKTGLVSGFYEEAQFTKNVQSVHASIRDLIKRRDTIKAAIALTNATTSITVGDESMTIAEAIIKRNTLEATRSLVTRFKSILNATKTEVETANAKIEKQALTLAEAALQKDNVKITDSDALAIVTPYLDANKFKLVDPLGAEELVKGLEEKVDIFDTEIDAVLSTVNATTFIEV